jgi:hypothetical protein
MEFGKISSQNIYDLFNLLKDSSLDSIVIDYELKQSDLPIEMPELTLIELVRLFPP